MIFNMLQKGNIIEINIGFGPQKFRVLKINEEQAEVLSMFDIGKAKFGNDNIYAGSTLDTTLCNWYNTLSDNAKNSIIPQNIEQDIWDDTNNGDILYQAKYNYTTPYTISKMNKTKEIGFRNVYTISIKDIIDYIGANNIHTESINNMFFATPNPTHQCIWLRSAYHYLNNRAWCINGASGSLDGLIRVSNNYNIHPVFTINLSKIDFKIK